MNRDLLEGLKNQAERLITALLFNPNDFDEKTAWMFILSFISNIIQEELRKTDTMVI